MATIAADVTPSPFTAEANPSPVSPAPHEPQEFTHFLTNHQSNTPPHSEELDSLGPPSLPSPLPVFINSIGELKGLSAAISAFHQCYDDLHNHLDSIKVAILSKLPLETPHITHVAHSSLQETDVPEHRVSQEHQEVPNPPKSELEGLCRMMCSRGIRKYLAANLSRLPELREEVPEALKLAPNAPKLVLECLGKFFLQGSKAFTRNSPMIPSREASILILECFLLMVGMDTTNEKDNWVDIEKAVKEEAESAALAWRKRLVFEGGVAKSNQIDARGLLLFIACFGIPASFKMEDIRDLVIAANAKEIVRVLQKSHVLMNKIPEIVEGMVKKRLEVDAVDIVYTFGLEERFNPQTVLISFLRESKASWKKPKKGSQGSTAALNDANKKQLVALKSICKCLERHKIDPAKLLPGWQISEKISHLQKEISDFDRKSSSEKAAAHKRKATTSESETSRRSKLQQEAKRSRYVPQQPSHHHHANNNYSSAPCVVYGGPGAGLLPESMISAGVGSTGIYTNRGTHPYSSIDERYASHAHAHAYDQPSVGLSSLYRTSASVEGFAGVRNATSSVGHGSRTSASDLYQFADSVVESESYPSSVGAVPSAHHSSYLYQV